MAILQSANEKAESIDQFPIAWAHMLPTVLVDVRFEWGNRERTKQSPLGCVRVGFRRPCWLGLVASHQSKFGYTSPSWQRAIESALRLARQQGWGICWAAKTPYASMIRHAVQRYGLVGRQIFVRCPSNSPNESGDGLSRSVESVILSSPSARGRNEIPVHDRAVVYLSDCVFAVDVRQGGKIEQLLLDRMSKSEIPPATTYVAYKLPASLHPTKHNLIQHGAVGWFYCTENAPQQSDVCGVRCCNSEGMHRLNTLQPLLSLARIRARNHYLIHCTRARKGPWPDQSIEQFHDEVLLQGMELDPVPMGSLQRILSQLRLVATDTCRNGDCPTVCFSDKPIEQLLEMRRFQSHLGRWDWEPYGLMIDRAWLQSQGARQVQYVSREIAMQMSQEDRTYAQVVTNRSNSQDWRAEQEWRMAGDLRLHTLPFSKAVVFVPTRRDALHLQHLSRWPIAWLES